MPVATKNLAVGVIVVILAVGYMSYVSLSTPLRYYVTVDELHAMQTASPPQIQPGERLKVVGTVVPGSMTRATRDDRQHRFVIEDAQRTINVSYAGPLPEQFQEGRQVVASGRLQSAEELLAHELLVKCASKYEAKEEGK